MQRQETPKKTRTCEIPKAPKKPNKFNYAKWYAMRHREKYRQLKLDDIWEDKIIAELTIMLQETKFF